MSGKGYNKKGGGGGGGVPFDDPRSLHHFDMLERYAHMRQILAAITDMSDCALPTVDQCNKDDFVALDAVRDAQHLQRLNPFPAFDAVQFYDVDKSDAEHTHYYLVPNPAAGGTLEEPRGSTTGYIHSFFEPFVEAVHARRIALELLTGSRRNEDEYTTSITLSAELVARNNERYANEQRAALPLFSLGSLRHTALLESVAKLDEERLAKQKDQTRLFGDATKNADLYSYWHVRNAILALWQWGSASGTALHRAIELFLDNPAAMPTLNPVYHTREFEYFLNFFRDVLVDKLDVVRSELRVADWRDDRDGTFVAERAARDDCPAILRDLLCATYLAGSVDFVGRERGAPENELVLGDWKRSKKIWERAFGNKFGRAPFADVPDCNLQHYYLQLNTYATLIEMNTHYRVTKMFIVVFHPNNENYVVHHVPDMRVAVHRMLVERIKENLSTVYIADTREEARKRQLMRAFLQRKRKDATNIFELMGIECHKKARSDNTVNDAAAAAAAAVVVIEASP